MKSMQNAVGLVWLMPIADDPKPERLTAGYHLGCSYLQAWLARQGVAARQYVFDRVPLEEVAKRIASDGVRLLGLSIKDTNYYAARALAASVHSIDPSIFIVFGGLTATFSDDLVLQHCPAAKACLRSYAEENFGKLVSAVLGGGDWRQTPGLSFRDRGLTIRTSDLPGELTSHEDLDFLPSPYLSGILPAEAAPIVGISTSRGCIFRCTFCNPTAMAGFKIAYHSDDRVVAELTLIDSTLRKSGEPSSKMLFLNEDIFALNPARTRRLCGRIADAGLKHLTFGCETRIEHLETDTLKAMYSAGFRFLKFGLESGNPRVLNTIKKVRARDGKADGYSAERRFLRQIEELVPQARGMGFRVAAGAIFGLPGETLADAIDTLDFIQRIDVDEYYHNFLQLFPGTEAFSRHKSYGLKIETNEGFYPSIYRTRWPYPVGLVPKIDAKLNRAFRRNVVQL